MRRAILALLILASVAAVPAGASASYKIGISDQSATTFANPLYAPLHLSLARYITPWDVMSRAIPRAQLAAWVGAARLANQRIVVAFEASHTRGHQRTLPSVKVYTKAVAAFHKAYPDIKDIQPWNEVNRCQRKVAGGTYVGQPTCHNPRAAAQYYMAARKVFRGAKVTGLDILDQAKVDSAVRYVKSFLRYAHPRPRYWGFHNYSDTNRFSGSRTRALLRATRSGEVWLTETGGIVHLGKSFPYSTSRAAKALGCMFTLARSSSRITRLYVYQFNGLPRGSSQFDAGLINPNQTLRPGYNVVKKRTARRCHR
jgi:hypothetical protein